MTFSVSRVTVRLTGGPGNQLFQVVAALASVDGDWTRIRVAASPDKDLRFTERLLGRRFRRVSRAQMFLGGFLPQHQLRWFWKQSRVLRKRIRRLLGRILPRSPSGGPRTSRRTTSPTDGVIRRVGPWAFASGYFQDAQWAPEWTQVVADEIRRNEEAALHHYAATVPVINVRGGDYRRNGWVLSDDYYRGVLESGFLDGYAAAAIVGVERRDITRVARLLEQFGITVVLPTEIADPLEAAFRDFFVLASAPRVVMSNSTFCWWATRVGPSRRRVAYPDGWIDHDAEAPLSRALKLPAWEAFAS